MWMKEMELFYHVRYYSDTLELEESLKYVTSLLKNIMFRNEYERIDRKFHY